MRSRIIKSIVMVVCLLFIAVYLYLNSYKVSGLSNDWAGINAGQAAPGAQLMLADELVYQKRLKASDIFDASGVRQINFVHLPKDVFARVQEEIEDVRLVTEQQEAPLSRTANQSALFAETTDRRIYFLAEGELKYMMTVIWNERLRARKLTRCIDADLCNSLVITSNNWGPIRGPYSNSDVSPDRRGMPRGRWAVGPRTVLDIQSRKRQRVLMQLNLLSVYQDQELRWQGAATQVKKVNTDSKPLEAGGKTLHAGVYLVLLDLQPGVNNLAVHFSKWSEPVIEGGNPLAAYVTAIGLKEAD